MVDFELCGVSKADIKKELKILEKARAIFWSQEEGLFAVNKDYDQWVISYKSSSDDERFNELVFYQLSKKELVKHQPPVGKIPTPELVKYQLSDSGNPDREQEETPPKDIVKTSKDILHTHTSASEKKSFGERGNVLLTELEYQSFVARCLNTDLADQLIQQLDFKIGAGYEISVVQSGGYFDRLCSYLLNHRKSPSTFKPPKKVINLSNLRFEKEEM